MGGVFCVSINKITSLVNKSYRYLNDEQYDISITYVVQRVTEQLRVIRVNKQSHAVETFRKIVWGCLFSYVRLFMSDRNYSIMYESSWHSASFLSYHYVEL